MRQIRYFLKPRPRPLSPWPRIGWAIKYFAMNFVREEDAAQWRRRNGVTREDQVFRDTRFRPPPNIGGTRGYDLFYRRYLINEFLNGLAVPQSVVRSIYRWMGRIFHFRMTGNRPQCGLSGNYLLLLVVYKLVWPHATYFECIAFYPMSLPTHGSSSKLQSAESL